MTTDPYYPVTPACPGRAVRVWVLWAGRRFRAARTPHPQTKLVRWATLDAIGEVVWLPRLGDAERWGAEPDAWQPEHPDKWAAPLPEPLLTADGQFWSATQSFAAVDEAEAAEMAREMERDRAGAKGRNGKGGDDDRDEAEKTPRARSKWWEQPCERYSAPGRISRHEAEHRAMRAVGCFMWQRDAHGTGFSPRGLLADMDAAIVRALAESEARSPSSNIGPLQPLPGDHADELTATDWLAVLRPLWRQALTLRASPVPMTHDDIARALGPAAKTGQVRSRAAVSLLISAALDEVHAIANGVATPAVVARNAALTAVQDSNRAYRRGGVDVDR